MKIKKKIKKKSGSKTEILRNLEAQPKRLVSYKKKISVFSSISKKVFIIHVHLHVDPLIRLYLYLLNRKWR